VKEKEQKRQIDRRHENIALKKVMVLPRLFIMLTEEPKVHDAQPNWKHRVYARLLRERLVSPPYLRRGGIN
jgi:hypothetical protein